LSGTEGREDETLMEDTHFVFSFHKNLIDPLAIVIMSRGTKLSVDPIAERTKNDNPLANLKS
jgi:hypothetical protein